MKQITIRVNDDGYGVIYFNGMKCAVMPFHMLIPDHIKRVDEGEFESTPQSEKPPTVTREDILDGLIHRDY